MDQETSHNGAVQEEDAPHENGAVQEDKAKQPTESTEEAEEPSPRDKKIAALKAYIESAKSQLADANSKTTELSSKLETDASSVVARHIKLLHDFNEIRDVGLGLIGMVAEGRHLRLQDVMGEFGVNPED